MKLQDLKEAKEDSSKFGQLAAAFKHIHDGKSQGVAGAFKFSLTLPGRSEVASKDELVDMAVATLNGFRKGRHNFHDREELIQLLSQAGSQLAAAKNLGAMQDTFSSLLDMGINLPRLKDIEQGLLAVNVLRAYNISDMIIGVARIIGALHLLINASYDHQTDTPAAKLTRSVAQATLKNLGVKVP